MMHGFNYISANSAVRQLMYSDVEILTDGLLRLSHVLCAVLTDVCAQWTQICPFLQSRGQSKNTLKALTFI